MKRLDRRQGLHLEAFGSILIITVMLTDHFLFSIQDGFILACAILSAITLAIGIRTVKYWDDVKLREESLEKAEHLKKTLKKAKKQTES